MTEQTTGTSKQNALLPWLIVAVVIVVILLVMLLKRGNSSEPAAAIEETAAAAAAARTQQQSSAVPGRTVGAPMSADAARESRQRTVEQRKRVQQQVDRTQAAFASRYGNEPQDAAWAGAKETELTKLSVSSQIEQMGVEPQDLAVDCKSTMCRVTGTFPSISAGDDWIALYMNNLGDKVPMASYKYIQNPDGTVTINVYAVGRK